MSAAADVADGFTAEPDLTLRVDPASEPQFAGAGLAAGNGAGYAAGNGTGSHEGGAS